MPVSDGITGGITESDADAVARRIARLVRWASLAAVVAGLGWLLSVAGRMAGDAFTARPIDTLRLVLEQLISAGSGRRR